MENVLAASASAQARGIREKKFSSKELVSAHLQRIKQVNPRINAVVLLADERALEEAERADRDLAAGGGTGPLHGVPMTIKDNLDTAGVISTGGTQGRAAFVPERDATVVKRLRGAGAILLGKTNTPELTMAYETANLLHGVTNNPYDPTLTSGGSSGGAAAIIAAGGSPFDIGSDTGGSIRVPSHFCGIAGLKPTSGRVPKTGHIIPLGGTADRMTVLGPMARTCEDLELILSVIAGPEGSDPQTVPVPLAPSSRVPLADLRAAVFTDDGLFPTDPDIQKAVLHAAAILREGGVSVREAAPPGLGEAFELTLGLWTADGGRAFQDILDEAGTRETHPFMQGVLQVCRAGLKSGAEFNALLARWDTFRAGMLQFMENFDILLGPVLPFPALPHGKTFDDAFFPAFRHTMLHNLTGWPVVVARAGTTRGGLPIGVQIAAPPFQEDVALAAGRHLERGLGPWPALPF